MCTDYWFDVLLTIPDWMREDLPETPEPEVKFFFDTYLDNFRYKPKDPIISEPQMKAFLEENGLELDKCTIIQRPKTNAYEALIKGHQIYRVHWVIECEFDEEKHMVIIPKAARLFIEEVYKATEENSLTSLDITHSIDPWEDSWIHKRVSYSEFRAHALCNKADAILDGFDEKINESIDKNITNIRSQMIKQMENLRDGLFTQHGSLLKEVKAFEERIKKTVSKPQQTFDYEKTIEELTQKNDKLTNELKSNKLSMFVILIGQIGLIFLLMLHYFTFK